MNTKRVIWTLAIVCVTAVGSVVLAQAKKAPAKEAAPASSDYDKPSALSKLLVMTEADPDSGPPPLTVQFKGEVYEGDDAKGAKFTWDFGDDSPQSKEANPKHTYKTPGSYTVVVKVLDEPTGRRGTDTLTIDVESPDE